MKRIHKLEISVAVGLIFAIISSVISFGVECNEIRNDVVRLHILANSDEIADQNLKLIVRDTLLSSGNELFSGAVNKENAIEILETNKYDIQNLIDKTLKDNGYNYKSNIYLINEYFTTRMYDGFTLPAGEYLSLKVILGEGDGHNWWCVMFPPLCLPAAKSDTQIDAVLGEDGAKIIQNYQEYEVRFKIIEIFEGIKSRIKSNHILNN